VIARHRPSQRRLAAYDWRGPPELIEHVSVSDHERLLITAFALKRLEAVRLEDLTRLRSHPMEKSQ
jgi:hypothetical protein